MGNLSLRNGTLRQEHRIKRGTCSFILSGMVLNEPRRENGYDFSGMYGLCNLATLRLPAIQSLHQFSRRCVGNRRCNANQGSDRTNDPGRIHWNLPDRSSGLEKNISMEMDTDARHYYGLSGSNALGSLSAI